MFSTGTNSWNYILFGASETFAGCARAHAIARVIVRENSAARYTRRHPAMQRTPAPTKQFLARIFRPCFDRARNFSRRVLTGLRFLAPANNKRAWSILTKLDELLSRFRAVWIFQQTRRKNNARYYTMIGTMLRSTITPRTLFIASRCFRCHSTSLVLRVRGTFSENRMGCLLCPTRHCFIGRDLFDWD